MTKKMYKVLLLVVILSMAIPFSVFAQKTAAPSAAVNFTILHTNDFHGQLEASNPDPIKASNPGMARTAAVVNKVRADKGAANVLLVDAGDEMQGSLLSNLGDGTATGKGKPTIGVFNAMGYNVATFGNHEFDWGQVNLKNRTDEATFPYVTANIVKNDTGNCATAGWTKPEFADAPYQVIEVGTAPNTAKVAFIGVTTTEVPIITVATATAGLCFKDPQASIEHYYDEVKTQADVIVVLSHLGNTDGGYGYGIPVVGDQTLAKNLINAGKPVDLIIGGHSHSNLTAQTDITVSGKPGKTTVVQAYYNGRNVGNADVTVATDGSVSVAWKVYSWKIPASGATTPFGWKQYPGPTDFLDATKDAAIDTLITGFASDPDYLAIVNEPIGYSAVDLPRSNTTDNMMATFVDDAIYKFLNTDTEPANDVDIFFNNAGGIRTDWCYSGGAWTTSGCTSGVHDPGLLTYGNMFTILPFGNATAVGTMTGAQLLQVIQYGPNVAGVIQPAGLKYNYFKFVDANPGPQPYAWGAFDVTVLNKSTGLYEPLDLKKTYKVGTNEFLAPAGGDGYNGFKYMTNITYWGDMLNAVNSYVTANYGTAETAYKGPNSDGTLDGRIVRNGGDTPDTSTIIPVTILHHNDSHGNLVKGQYVGYTQLATLIKQERAHNPNRTLLFSLGDNIQGDAMMYYFKSAGLGYTSDGASLPANVPAINPLIAAFDSMNYSGMLLGNHEFNFGSQIFTSVLKDANFPILGANVADDGQYGINKITYGSSTEPQVADKITVRDAIELTVPSGNPDRPIKLGFLGLTNHRVPNYELPSNIPGLTFYDPIETAQRVIPILREADDAVVALTHIGFTEDPKSVEVDKNVDTNLAAIVPGIDAIIGSHSHTNPQYGFGDYKFLPTILAGPDGKPVVINQAYRYNNTLGEVVLGMRAKAGGGYEVVSQTGRYLSVSMSTAEDANLKSLLKPYVDTLASYNDKVIGQTTEPITAIEAFTTETNGANLQADAALFELEKNGITDVDFHLSGAMTNKKVADGATSSAPVTLKIADMFTLMPYENSLVVIKMNGPQIKTVLERGYRNYYYYKYVPGYGGYSYYTTCMLDTNAGNVITYRDTAPSLPDGNNVVSMVVNGKAIDFKDATKFYNVSTVNYLAAGSCNMNDAGKTLWPLDQIVHDTQYYVRDAVIDYITNEGTVSPTVEGRLSFLNQFFYFPSIFNK